MIDVQIVLKTISSFESSASNIKLSKRLPLFKDRIIHVEMVMGNLGFFCSCKDGFIDARELQRVLSALGLKDEAAIDDCKKMIDDDNDGRIDFDEFTKFMEGIFS
ncbi:hypothetical protein R6Q59_003653 [Mikania micrantha]